MSDVSCAEAREIVERLRGRHADFARDETIALGGAPAVGFGQGALLVPAAAGASSPVAIALITSVVGAATGWTIEEIAKTVRGRRRGS